MGTDIHLWVERREPNGPWQSADKWSPDEYTDAANAPKCVAYTDRFYHDRNYDVFAILAGVRNGHGFAGVKTGEGFNPISEPKGWPEDCCPELQLEAETIEHTPSWLTLAELLAYDWTQIAAKEGVVTPKEWATWRQEGRPEAWSGGVSGPRVLHVTNEEMEAAALGVTGGRISELRREPDGFIGGEGPLSQAIARRFDAESVYTRVQWTLPYWNTASRFFVSVIPRLLRLGSPENVRIVFYFDS